MKKFFKNILAMTLAAAMTLPLAACSEGGAGSGSGGGNSGGGTSGSGNNGSNDSAKQDKIVVWTLANDLKQFAERYTNETGNEVEVIVYDSADFKTKINQTLGTKSSDLDVFVGEPQMLPDFFEAGFSADLSCFDEQVKTRLADYTYQAGCDSDGVLRAISYQSCPGSVIYSRDIAEKVYGSDDHE